MLSVERVFFRCLLLKHSEALAEQERAHIGRAGIPGPARLVVLITPRR
jgi:hypothetical protein